MDDTDIPKDIPRWNIEVKRQGQSHNFKTKHEALAWLKTDIKSIRTAGSVYEMTATLTGLSGFTVSVGMRQIGVYVKTIGDYFGPSDLDWLIDKCRAAYFD